MSARVLIVDDVPTNRRLLEAMLTAEYFDVRSAESGLQAIEICHREMIDLVLLDVMMPEMDGFAVCRQLKGDPSTWHIPVVLVTALDGRKDRVEGLEAGADDFLTKPIRAMPLLSRIRNLVRLKMSSDELRKRARTALELLADDSVWNDVGTGAGGRVAVVADEDNAHRIAALIGRERSISIFTGVEVAASLQPFDLLILDLSSRNFDALRLCAQLRSDGATRQLPVLLIGHQHDEERVAKGLELGANDYCHHPIDRNEFQARIRTQIRRTRYEGLLRRSVQETIDLAIIDPLTGLHNRRFFEHHLARAFNTHRSGNKPLSLLVLDIDRFKGINDVHGHDAGDEVLRHFARLLTANLRVCDLSCRLGGEEFVVIMPDADLTTARSAAERIRLTMAEASYEIPFTVSIGLACLEDDQTAKGLLKRADNAVYEAKDQGRNRVVVSHSAVVHA